MIACRDPSGGKSSKTVLVLIVGVYRLLRMQPSFVPARVERTTDPVDKERAVTNERHSSLKFCQSINFVALHKHVPLEQQC